MTVLAIYADGGCVQRNPSPLAGTWAWCHVAAGELPVRRECGLLVPCGASSKQEWPRVDTADVSNNQAEFYALLGALEALPDGWSGQVCTDSRITLGRFFWSYPMRGIPNHWWKRGAAALRRLGRLQPVLLDGHPTREQLRIGIGKRGNAVSHHNVWCDQACAQRAAAWLATSRRVA